MKYEYPPLPEPDGDGIWHAAEQYESDWVSYHNDAYEAGTLRQYAEQAVAPLLAEIDRLKRGEFICNRCGLRKNADTPEANF